MKTIKTTQSYVETNGCGTDTYNINAALSGGNHYQYKSRHVTLLSDSLSQHEAVARDLAELYQLKLVDGFEPVIVNNGYVFLAIPK